MKQKIPTNILQAINQAYIKTKPISIFIYGSHARGDNLTGSDFEAGAIYSTGKRKNRLDLDQIHQAKNLNIYPWEIDQIKSYNPDTPFPKAIFMRELTSGGATTIKGKSIIETLKPPEITLADMLETVYFELGYAVASMLSIRNQDKTTGINTFSKSVLFGARAYIIYKFKQFPINYFETVELIKKSDLDQQYKQLVSHTLEIRQGETIDPDQIFANITFLNQIVAHPIKHDLARGNQVILPGTKVSAG